MSVKGSKGDMSVNGSMGDMSVNGSMGDLCDFNKVVTRIYIII
jgi:hypothetical protein